MNFQQLADEYKDRVGHLTNVGEWGVWNRGETCNVFAFCLDGKTYTCEEDPDDGYRSYCTELVVSDEPMTFGFDCEVRITMDRNDVLSFTDVVTGEEVLEVGTDHADDYYPYCVQKFNPLAMAVNQ